MKPLNYRPARGRVELAIWGYDEGSINSIDPGVDEGALWSVSVCKPPHYLHLSIAHALDEGHWQPIESHADRMAVHQHGLLDGKWHAKAR